MRKSLASVSAAVSKYRRYPAPQVRALESLDRELQLLDPTDFDTAFDYVDRIDIMSIVSIWREDDQTNV